MTQIRTLSGDLWDVLPWREHGEGADRAELEAVIAANWDYIDTAVFGGNVAVEIPPSPEPESATVPPWRR